MICDEFGGMIKHVLRGITVDDDTLAVDAIREAGYGGSFLGVDHTVRHFRKELYFPLLFQRQTIDQWMDAGSKMATTSRTTAVKEILAKAGPVALPPRSMRRWSRPCTTH